MNHSLLLFCVNNQERKRDLFLSLSFYFQDSLNYYCITNNKSEVPLNLIYVLILSNQEMKEDNGGFETLLQVIIESFFSYAKMKRKKI